MSAHLHYLRILWLLFFLFDCSHRFSKFALKNKYNINETENYCQISAFILLIVFVCFFEIIENRRSFKKLLIHWIVQFEIFFFKLCNNLICETWLYTFVTFTLMMMITLFLFCFHIACISFVSSFNVVSISFFRFALICDFDSNEFFFANSVILLIIIDFNILFIVFNRKINL